MNSDIDPEQNRVWQSLHDRITETLEPLFNKNLFGEGDYLLVDDNWGRYQLDMEIQNLNLFNPEVVKSLQALLVGYPDWRIPMGVDVTRADRPWPPMGVHIYDDEVVDKLLREYLPEEFRNFTYESGPQNRRAE